MDGTDLFKELIWHALVKAALQRLFALVPLLGWGPIGYVISFFAMKYADQLYDAVKLLIQIELIVFRNKETEKAFNTASVKLKIVARDKGLDSAEYKEARDEDKKSLSQMVMYDIARRAA